MPSIIVTILLIVLAGSLLVTHIRMRSIKRQLRIDTVTQISNRHHIIECMCKLLKTSKDDPFAILFIDMDEFKAINDTYGHNIGDIALQQFASIMRKQLRKSDIFGRYGGDEFVAILPNTGIPSEVEIVANKMYDAICGPIDIEGKNVDLKFSIGATIYSSVLSTAHMLLKEADDAMYVAKAAGKNRLIFHDIMTICDKRAHQHEKE